MSNQTFRELLDTTLVATYNLGADEERDAGEHGPGIGAARYERDQLLAELYGRLGKLDATLGDYAATCDRIHPDGVRSILDGVE